MIFKKFVFFSFFLLALAKTFAEPIRIATWNIRCIDQKDSLNGDTWLKRAPEISLLTHFHHFEIIGMQEVDSIQQMMLSNLLPEYKWISGEHHGNPIAYLPSRFEVVNQGTFWYSKDGQSNTKGWDARHPRFCNWAHFLEKNTKKEFFIFNSHWDHKGDTARIESAKLALNKIPDIVKNKTFFFLGDFNSKPNRKALKLLEKGGLFDARTKAKYVYAPKPSFNHYKENNPEDNNLDYIYFLGNVNIIRFGILDNTYRDENRLRFPSDHFPLMIDFEFKYQIIDSITN